MFYRSTFSISFILFFACSDSENNPIVVEQPEPLMSWCDASLGGVAGTRALAVDFSRAHVGRNLFGPSGDWLKNDGTLTELLSEDASVNSSLLNSYADSFEGVCALGANTKSEREAMVKMQEGFAVITPGSDIPVIPEEASAIVIDATDLHASDSLMLAASTAFSEDLLLATRRMREMQGFPAQEGEWTHYEARTTEKQIVLKAKGSVDLPLYVLTSARLTPEAATTIGGLKLLGKVIVIGHPVSSAVAESTWTGIKDKGLLWRSSSLSTVNKIWPDFVEADFPAKEPLFLLDQLASIQREPLATKESTRSTLEPYNRLLGEPSTTLGRKELRAALLISHGVFDWFYSYYDLVGRSIEESLESSLVEVDTIDDSIRLNLTHLYGRFIHHLHDGHGYYSDWGTSEFPDGYMNIQLQQVNGEPMVRVSQHAGLNAGDVITHINGGSSDQWFEEAMKRYSAATQGWRWVMASDELLSMYSSMELTLRDPDGVTRTEIIVPESFEVVPWGGTFRGNGRLDMLEAPHIEYVNLSDEISSDADLPEIVSAIKALNNMEGLILDMRGYPGIDYYEIWKCFFSGNFGQTIFDHPTWTGPSDFRYQREHWHHDADSNVFTGPTVVMMSNKSVSSAENFAQVMVTRENVHVVGQHSAGTNGTITTLWLPGMLQVNFTGMRLLNPDGSDIHGFGIMPEEEVVPTAKQFANGEDPELMKAIAWIDSQL